MISHKKQKVILLLGYVAVVALFWIWKLPCVFQCFLGIPCPGCGMTRALVAAANLNFADAFANHPMFWSLPFLGLYFLFDGGLFRYKWLNNLFLCLIGIGFFAVWLWKMLTFVEFNGTLSIALCA